MVLYELEVIDAGAKSVPRIGDNKNMPCIVDIKQRILAI